MGILLSVSVFFSVPSRSTENLKMVDAAVQEKLEAGFAKLQAADNCKSLLKKYLTREVLDKTKDLKTSFGSTLLDVVQSGMENLDSGVGVYAPDAESYTIFHSARCRSIRYGELGLWRRCLRSRCRVLHDLPLCSMSFNPVWRTWTLASVSTLPMPSLTLSSTTCSTPSSRTTTLDSSPETSTPPATSEMSRLWATWTPRVSSSSRPACVVAAPWRVTPSTPA